MHAIKSSFKQVCYVNMKLCLILRLRHTLLYECDLTMRVFQEMACQEVPKDVLGLAMMDPNFKKGRGNLRKGFGRSDEKLRPGLGGPGLGAGSTASQVIELNLTANISI